MCLAGKYPPKFRELSNLLSLFSCQPNPIFLSVDDYLPYPLKSILKKITNKIFYHFPCWRKAFWRLYSLVLQVTIPIQKCESYGECMYVCMVWELSVIIQRIFWFRLNWNQLFSFQKYKFKTFLFHPRPSGEINLNYEINNKNSYFKQFVIFPFFLHNCFHY